MNTLLQKPHLPFLLVIPILLLFAIIIGGDSAIDINIHDTYFVIGHAHLLKLIAIVAAVYGLFYWFIPYSGKIFSKRLTAAHLLISFGAPLLALLLWQFITYDLPQTDTNMALYWSIAVLWAITIVAQLLFPVNIVYALTRTD